MVKDFTVLENMTFLVSNGSKLLTYHIFFKASLSCHNGQSQCIKWLP